MEFSFSGLLDVAESTIGDERDDEPTDVSRSRPRVGLGIHGGDLRFQLEGNFRQNRFRDFYASGKNRLRDKNGNGRRRAKLRRI